MAYDNSSVHQYEEEVFNNPPYVQVNNYSSAVLDSVSSTTAPNLQPPALYASPVIYKTPYVQQYSLDVQQAITPTTTLDVGYFGDHGTHLQGVVDINEIQPGAFANTSIGYAQGGGSCTAFTSQACEAPLNQIRPYLGYTAINDDAEYLQFELQLAAGKGDQEVRRQEHDRCQLYLEPRPYRRTERLGYGPAEYLQPGG